MKFLSFFQYPTFLKIFSLLLFVGWMVLFYQKINVREKLPQRPNTWSQIDRASMALTYYKDKAPFFLPRCHQANNNPEGITAGEFPLIPYSVSKLYGWFGFKEIYHRGFVLALSLIGFIFCFLLASKFLKSPLWASFSAVLWLVSPNLIYHTISFLPDTPALAFILIAVYFLFKNKNSPSSWDLIGFSLFFSLAALIRVSSTFPLGSVVLAYMICYRHDKFKGGRKKIFFLVACIIPLILATAWVIYSRWILHHYHIFTFLMQPMPPSSWKELVAGLKIFVSSADQYYIRGFFYFLIAGSVAGLFFIRRSNKFLLLATVFTYLSFFVLFIILFKKGIEHHYYWVPFQIVFFFHIAWLADLASQIKMPLWGKILTGVIVLIFINYNSIHLEKQIKKIWTEKQSAYAAYNDLEPYLDSLGITYDDRVATYSDPTFNNTLYLMNRKGWTLDKDEEISHFHKAFQTCDYAVLNDTMIIRDTALANYFDQLLGVRKGLYIYSLKPILK